VTHGWRLLGNPQLWMAVMLALILVWSVVWWNAQNQWISFTYQAQHGSGSAWQVTHVLRFLLMQILTYGPLLLWG
jgi:hypothetical protein